VRPRDLFVEPQGAEQGSQDWLLFAKLRITPMLSLGRALCAQRLIFEAIASAVGRTWGELFGFWRDDAPSVKHLLPTTDSLRLFRIALVDLQEEEDIGILIRCHNPSLAACLLTAAQNLTLGQVREIDPEEFGAVENSRIFRTLKDGVAPPEKEGSKTPFDSNHAFRWTRSSVSVSLERFTVGYEQFCAQDGDGSVADAGENGGDARASEGYLSFVTAISFLPGHHWNAYTLLPDWMRRETKDESGRPTYLLHTYGTDDLLLQSTDPAPKDSGGKIERVGPFLVPAGRLVEACWTLLREIEREGDRCAKEVTGRTRHLTAWSTTVSVPVPFVQTSTGKNPPAFHPAIDSPCHAAAFHHLLEVVKTIPPFGSKSFVGATEGPVGMSATLRRSLWHLKANFASVYSSFYTFDVVLDYLDVALVLDRIAKEGLLARMGERASASDYLRRIGLGESLALAEILEAIRDGMEFRLRHIYPESPLRDHSLDLRTSVLQPVLAAEAVLKSSIAVLRKDLLGIDEEKRSKSHHYAARRCIGAILKLGFKPGLDAVRCEELHTECSNAGKSGDGGPAAYRTRLAVFEADFPRLLHIPSYCIFYHEAFHLVFYELCDLGPELDASMSPLGANLEGDRVDFLVQETFVQMCMLLFVFGGDTQTLLRHHATVISTYPQVLEGLKESDPAKQTESVREAVIDNLFPALLAAWVFEAAATAAEPSPPASRFSASAAWRARERLSFGKGFRLDHAIDKIVELAKSVRPWLADWDWLFPEDRPFADWRPRLGRWFVQVAHATESLQALWNPARLLYIRHCRRILRESNAEETGKGTPRFDSMMGSPDGVVGEEAWPAAEVGAFLELSDSVDRLIEESWAQDLAIALASENDGFDVTPLASTDFGFRADPKTGRVVDPNLLVRRTLYNYVKLVTGEGSAWGDLEKDGKVTSHATRALKREEPKTVEGGASSPTWAFPDAGRPYAPILTDRISPTPFCADPRVRRWLTGLQIGVQLTLWDVASRCRARRAITLQEMKQDSQAANPEATDPG
jgi:hypothetical protein